ncbi:MAG: hypothetical protein ACI85N_001768 [Gammaproteobacteria bacterium]|jgi:hypothetical protein
MNILLQIKKNINTLRVSRRYGKACKLVNKEKYSEAKSIVDFALNLNVFDFMISLHKALKIEIEYELGNYDDCRNAIINIRTDFKSDPELWNKKEGKDVVDRVNSKINKQLGLKT